MALTGACLVLFVTFHCLMNAVAIIRPDAYNMICQFLGANWYALVASVGLAALFIIHIIYASVLTIQNRKARGADRYAINSRPPQVEWSSKNMYVLGIVVLAFLVLHLIQFWAKMQLQELRHEELTVLSDGTPLDPQMGTIFLQLAFKEWWTPVVYIIGFIALWFHMNHGFWSMFHTVGWDNNIWIERLKKIGCWWTTIVVALFIAQAVVFTVKANNPDDNYLNDKSLTEQYAEPLAKIAEPVVHDFLQSYNAVMEQARMFGTEAPIYNFVASQGEAYLTELKPIATAAQRMGVAESNETLNLAVQIVTMIEHITAEEPQTGNEEESTQEDVHVIENETAPAANPENANNQ